MMSYMIAGFALGVLSTTGAITSVVAFMVYRSGKRNEPPTKEEWNMQRDSMWM